MATAGVSRRFSLETRSTYTLPLHSTSRRTSPCRARAASSSMTGCQRPSDRSRSDETTSGCRRRLFGVSTISGSGSVRKQQRLAPQEVEVLRGRRAVGQPQVDVRRGVEEPLGPRRRVVRSLAFVAVRQEQDERRRLAPLRAAGRDELVDDHLRAVDEVAVLRLPQHEALRLLHVVAELEADACVLRQRAVANLEGRRGLRQRLQRHVLAGRSSRRGRPRDGG